MTRRNRRFGVFWINAGRDACNALPPGDSFDRAESSRCDGVRLVITATLSKPPGTTGVSRIGVRARKLFATAKLDPRTRAELECQDFRRANSRECSPVQFDRLDRLRCRATSRDAVGRAVPFSRSETGNSGESDLVAKDVLHHCVTRSPKAERQVSLLSAGVVLLDIESHADHIG